MHPDVAFLLRRSGKYKSNIAAHGLPARLAVQATPNDHAKIIGVMGLDSFLNVFRGDVAVIEARELQAAVVPEGVEQLGRGIALILERNPEETVRYGEASFAWRLFVVAGGDDTKLRPWKARRRRAA